MKKVKGWVAMLWTRHNDYLDKECERQGAFGISLRFRIILVGLLTKLREHFATAGGEPWCSDLQPRCLRNKWRV